jgi:calcium/calmodulin-dependent protein kinase I
MNESFHEARPSFRSLVAKFEHNKGSFTYQVTKNTSVREMMQKQKSIRSLGSQMDKMSYRSCTSKYSIKSINSIDLLDDVDMKEEDEEEDEEPNLYEKSKYSCTTTAPPAAAAKAMTPLMHKLEAEKPTHRSSEKKRSPKGPVFQAGAFDDCYELGDELGSGAYAVVKVGTHRSTGKSYAIKIVEIESMEAADLEALHIEIMVMSRLNHPNIVRLYETYRESEYYYLVTEKMMGGELLDRVVQKTFYNEKEARDTCKILFQAMSYCHSKRIAHRDLKPENLLLQSDDNDWDLKIADFGFAKKCPPSGLTTMCGTPGYVAPEILERVPYDTQCDLWSLGVIVYILLGGYSPFEEKSQDALFARIRAGDYTFHEEFWHSVSSNAKDLIRSLLTVDPRQRLTSDQALQHSWMTVSEDVLASTDLGVNLHELKRYNAKRKFKAAVKTVIATQKLTLMFHHVC